MQAAALRGYALAPNTTDHMALSVGYAHWNYNADVPSPHAAGGWCWAEGDISEFTGADTLREDVLWLTNLPWEYHVSLGTHKFPHLKRNDFLPVPLDRLAQELAIDPQDQSLYANAMAVIGSRLISLGVRCYGPTLLQECMRQSTFAQAVANTMGWRAPSDAKIEDELHREIIWQNLAPKSQLRHDTLRDDCAILRAPWFTHAKVVLSCPIPSMTEDWIEVEVALHDRLNYLRQEDLPAVVELHDVALTSSWSSIYDLASSPLRWSRKRRWMASNEVLFLAEHHCAMELGRIFIQPGGYICDALTWNMPNAGDALTLSISAGLLAHGHWLSGAIPLTHRYWPLRSMWLRAADRLRIATMLPALQGIPGLKLVSYGEGAVYIAGPPEALTEATLRAPHIGLSPTQSSWSAGADMSITQKPDWLPSSQGSFDKASFRLSNRPISDLLRLDAAAIHSLTDENAAVMQIAEILKEVTHGSNA